PHRPCIRLGLHWRCTGAALALHWHDNSGALRSVAVAPLRHPQENWPQGTPRRSQRCVGLVAAAANRVSPSLGIVLLWLCVIPTVRLRLRVAKRRTWPGIYAVSKRWPAAWSWLWQDAARLYRAHTANPWNGAPQRACRVRSGCLTAWLP